MLSSNSFTLLAMSSHLTLLLFLLLAVTEELNRSVCQSVVQFVNLSVSSLE